LTERKEKERSGNLSCSFCGKSQAEVRKLIAGPAVFICAECVVLCNEIIAEGAEREEAALRKHSVPKPVEIKAILDQYVGNYEMYPNFVLAVTRQGDRLWVQATNQPRLGIYAESEAKFSYRAVDAQITFVRNKEGKVDKLILHQHGLDLPAWKGGLLVHFGGMMLKELKRLGERSSKGVSSP